MKSNFIKYAVVALAVLTTSSCSNLLDEKVYTFVSGDELVSNKSYSELVSGAYTVLAYPFQWGNYHTVVNFDTDYQTGPTWAFTDMGAGNFYENGSVNNFWIYYYQAIHRAQYHASLIKKMDLAEKVKNNAVGELEFLTAWSYFNLVQFYGPLPLYTYSVSEGADFYKPRSSVKDVYDYIISELKAAEEHLYTRQDASYQSGHVCRGAARALLAKVYCTIGSASMAAGSQISVMGGPAYTKDADGNHIRVPYPSWQTFSKDQVAGYEEFDSKAYYKLGMDKAKEVIDSGEFDLYPSQKTLWDVSSKNGKEFIFTLQTLAGNDDLSNYVATDYAGYWYTADGATYLTDGYYVQRDHWYQTFDDGDDRITWGVIHRYPYSEYQGKLYYCYYPAKDSVKVRLGLDGYQPTDELRYDAHLYGSKLMKFRQVSAPLTGNRTDFNFPFMRYAEVLLLYAEADNEVNGTPSQYAIQQVEKLNSRNKSPLVSGVKMGQTLITANQEYFRSYILQERAKEFAAEGIRRFDLLRWGIYLQTMNSISPIDGLDENGNVKRREKKHLLLPLPANEVNTNIYIDKNNPGW
ncbi:MAG: RagB/SusD family nutrient uptake outer membrane protein [Bacteroidales bacterium]|nr:RagB/SusD family nutrient uptake outer membrane protein [Bacteroidales bacterium]